MPLSIRDMAAALGVSKSQIARDKSDGMPMTDAAAALSWREEHRDLSRSVEGRVDRPMHNPRPQAGMAAGPEVEHGSSASGSSDAGDVPSAGSAESAEYKQARTKREQIAVQTAQLELDKLRGQLIDVDEAKRLAFTSFRSIRDAVLNVPARVAAQCAAETDALRVEQLIDAELTSALQRFDPARLLAEPDADDDDEAG